MRRKLALISVAAVTATSAGLIGLSGPAYAASTCSATYTITNQWAGGFQAAVDLTNTGAAITGWNIGWTFGDSNQKITQIWNATATQTGTAVTATNMSYNGSVASGGTVEFGFLGSWTTADPVPTAFTLNGASCGGTTPVNQPPTVALTSPTSGTAYTAPATVNLAANAADSDGTVSKVEFYNGSTLLGTDTSAPYTYSWANVGAGSYTVTAKAYDNGGLSTTSSPVTFTVSSGGTGGNLPPTVALTSPAAGSSYTAPASIAIAANAADSDGTVSKVEFYNGSTLLGTDTTAPYTYTWSNVALGSYTLTAKAYDNSGAATTSSPVTVTITSGGGSTGTHVDNPYAGAKGYVNPDWSTEAAGDGGTAVANQSTAIWLDRIAAIAGTGGAMGLQAHLDHALVEAAGAPTTIEFVIYDLPDRDCAALASNGELQINADGLNKYEHTYIDPIAALMADPKYASLRIVTVIEPDSLPNLVTNQSIANCAAAQSSGVYVQGVQYALNKLHAISNVYTYIDAAHHAWLGWDSNFGPAADLFASVARGTTAGYASVDGFITNTANYSALQEPYFTVNSTVNGTTVRQSTWVDWNQYVDELSYAQALRTKLVSEGFSSNLGMLIDTSRDGWGGTARPAGPSTSTDLNTFVDQSRVDRRIHAGNWCNQSGAGIGERPQANPQTGIDAYVWIKPPGESDGSSTAIPNDQGKGFDRMCDPTYTGNSLNGNNLTGALPNSPLAGAWFSAQFHQLLQNAYPPLS